MQCKHNASQFFCLCEETCRRKKQGTKRRDKRRDYTVSQRKADMVREIERQKEIDKGRKRQMEREGKITERGS